MGKKNENCIEASGGVEDNDLVKNRIAHLCFSMALFAGLHGCDQGDECSQGNVDGCYMSVGCDGSQNCTLTTDKMNNLCVCLGDLGCDQEWYHVYCDDAPYEDGECCVCDDESELDGGSCE